MKAKTMNIDLDWIRIKRRIISILPQTVVTHFHDDHRESIGSIDDAGVVETKSQEEERGPEAKVGHYVCNILCVSDVSIFNGVA
jgi:hypothetical protein